MTNIENLIQIATIEQIYELLNKLNYEIGTKDDNELKLLKLINQELKKKHYSYQQQDIKK